MKLYSRYEHGSLPIDITVDGNLTKYALQAPDGLHEYHSARQLLIYLTRHPEARHWTFDRYFRLGRYAPYPQIEPIIPVLELFEPGGIVVDTNSQQSLNITSSSVIIQTPLGIDLAKRGHEVEKLLFSGFRGWIYSAGYDPKDVLQEVYKGILIRNQGTCPFDARKSSFGHYVHQICHCVLSNYHRRETRHYSMETTGVNQWTKDGLQEVDVAESNSLDTCVETEPEHTVIADMAIAIKQDRNSMSPEGIIAHQLLPLLYAGCSRNEMADILGVKKQLIGRSIAFIRRVAKRWQKV